MAGGLTLAPGAVPNAAEAERAGGGAGAASTSVPTGAVDAGRAKP
ncbi:hypothetical protein [Pseudonocardia sp. T1-2H]